MRRETPGLRRNNLPAMLFSRRISNLRKEHPEVSLKGILATLLAASTIAPGLAQPPAVLEADRAIIAYEQRDSQLMANLEYLCDRIGPRLTGSDRLRKANEWASEKMKEYGLQNVHQEAYTIPEGWERGTVQAEIVKPVRFPITAAAMAWTPATKGAVTGPVVMLDIKPDGSDLDRYAGKLRNAIVMMSKPAVVEEHPSRMEPGYRRPSGTDEEEQPPARLQQIARVVAFFNKEGVAAALLDAGKPQMLLNMTGSWRAAGGIQSRFPRLFVVHEHYAMLARLLASGTPVSMRLDARSRFVRGPITVYNTVGEIPGTDKPDEIVLCGAHLDSWDLAQGAVDNGTGSMVVLEAARLIKACGLKPRRTIRFVLFSGEEEGLVGSQEYVKAHKAEMPRFSAVFVHDTGTGKVTGIGLHGNPQDQSVFENEMPILKELGVVRYSTFLMGGTDHASFHAEGVPAFWFMQDPADYNWMHHSQSDTFDKALPDDLKQGAEVMAICAFNTAQRDELLPRSSPKAPSQ